jgi:hypothetical protein
MALHIDHLQFMGGFRLLLILASLMVHPLASAEDPTGSPEQKLSKTQIIKLVDQYVDALERQDFEAWNELVAPLHPGFPLLTPTNFLEKASMVKSLSVKQINGLNADLKIKYRDGRKQIGSLQIHASGQIKYTPFLFEHPVVRAFSLIQSLLNDRTTLFGATSNEASRMELVWELDAMGIPLCEYDPLAPVADDRRAAARKIFQWLEENGQTFDNTEPKVFIAPGEFARCAEKARPPESSPLSTSDF